MFRCIQNKKKGQQSHHCFVIIVVVIVLPENYTNSIIGNGSHAINIRKYIVWLYFAHTPNSRVRNHQ